MTRERREPTLGNAGFWLSITLLAIVVSGVVDLFLDAPPTLLSFHVFNELLLVVLSLGVAIYLWIEWYRAQQSLGQARQAMQERSRERDEWRDRARKLLEGLGEAIDEQMRAWELTPTEREMALLMLKGLSHREIAEMSNRSERTVRQHAVAIYRKSGLAGRAELSAFFLEDLLLPRESEPAPSVTD